MVRGGRGGRGCRQHISDFGGGRGLLRGASEGVEGGWVPIVRVAYLKLLISHGNTKVAADLLLRVFLSQRQTATFLCDEVQACHTRSVQLADSCAVARFSL